MKKILIVVIAVLISTNAFTAYNYYNMRNKYRAADYVATQLANESTPSPDITFQQPQQQTSTDTDRQLRRIGNSLENIEFQQRMNSLRH